MIKKKFISMLLACVMISSSATSVCAAQDSNSDTSQTQYPLTITDDLGTEVTIEKEPEKIVSLSPANTETLFALGAGDKVVGRTDYCNYPEEASDIASIGSYSEPNTELIISMEPDIVFASDYIDDSIRSQVEAAGAKVVVFSANSIDSVEQDIFTAGEILNLSDKACEVTDTMKNELSKLQSDLSSIEDKKTAFIDLGSFYSAGPGSLLDDVLKNISVENITEESGEMWPQLSVEKIIEKDPDVYISLYTTPEELKKTTGISDLECIKNDSIIYYDGLSPQADMIQRAGPRIVEGARLLAQAIYPDIITE